MKLHVFCFDLPAIGHVLHQGLCGGDDGGRRSEVARPKLDDLEERKPVAADPKAPIDEMFPFWRLGCGARKHPLADAGESLLLVGRPVARCDVRRFGEFRRDGRQER